MHCPTGRTMDVCWRVPGGRERRTQLKREANRAELTHSKKTKTTLAASTYAMARNTGIGGIRPCNECRYSLVRTTLEAL